MEEVLDSVTLDGSIRQDSAESSSDDIEETPNQKSYSEKKLGNFYNSIKPFEKALVNKIGKKINLSSKVKAVDLIFAFSVLVLKYSLQISEDEFKLLLSQEELRKFEIKDNRKICAVYGCRCPNAQCRFPSFIFPILKIGIYHICTKHKEILKVIKKKKLSLKPYFQKRNC
jgi:hypothetical protein